jgi:hypothetical protein
VNHFASVELWANFIYVQGWYMLWNCGQMSDEHREKLASGATRIALKFPALLRLIEEPRNLLTLRANRIRLGV